MDNTLNKSTESETMISQVKLIFWVITCRAMSSTSPFMKLAVKIGVHANYRYQQTKPFTRQVLWSFIGLSLGLILGWLSSLVLF